MKHMWSEEEIQSFKKDISNLVDSKGNPRFVEGEGVNTETTGLEITYSKWSLSGTHLMLVTCGNIDNNITLDSQLVLTRFNIPKFILDKINPLFNGLIEIKALTLYNEDLSTQGTAIKLFKSSEGYIYTQWGNTTTTKSRIFRIQFDLLIDSE